MNLVVGATGNLGSRICELLREEGKPVRGLVRPTADAEKAERLRSMGAEIVNGDVHDRAALNEACRGATAVISTVSAMPMCYDPDANNIQQVDLEGVAHAVLVVELSEVAGAGLAVRPRAHLPDVDRAVLVARLIGHIHSDRIPDGAGERSP